MIRRPPRSTPLYSSAASDVYKRQVLCGNNRSVFFRFFGRHWVLIFNIAYFQRKGELIRGILTEIKFYNGVRVEIIEGRMPFELNSAMSEIMEELLSFLYQDVSFPVLDNNPDYSCEAYRMGNNPRRWCLHPAETFSFR